MKSIVERESHALAISTMEMDWPFSWERIRTISRDEIQT